MATDHLTSQEVTEALKHYESGAFREAARIFEAVLSRAPGDAKLLRLCGLSLTRAGRPHDGLSLLAHALELAPEEPLAHLHYGVGLHAVGQFAEAARIFDVCLRLLPRNPAPALNLAAAHLDLGNTDAAYAAVREALARASDSAEAHYLLGLTELGAGRFPEARDELTKATRLAPKLAKAWLNLGVARYRLSDVQGALEATKRCLSIDPHNSMGEANLSVFLALRGEQEEAINRLRKVVERDPNCVPARVNLGSQLVIDREPIEALDTLKGDPPKGSLGAQWRAQRISALLQLGRRKEARAELEAVEEPLGEAEILIAWRRLLFSVRQPVQAERFAKRVAELADQEKGTLLEHRIIAHFDLARFRNSRRERRRGFEHLIKGHALIARSQPFSRSDYAGFFEATKKAYSRERLAAGPQANNRDTIPLFIVGLPRSGTTLTEQILASHSAVHGAGERPHLHNCLSRLVGSMLEAKNVPKAANLSAPSLSAAARKYLVDLHALAPGARYITDKMPGNALHLGFVATLLPRARVILCERDLRDTALSIFQHRFFGYHPYAHDLRDLGWYIAEHQKLMDHWLSVLPLPVFRLRLNDWVEDFQGTLKKVLDFLDLPYEEGCERFYESPRKVRTASLEQVRRPVNSRGIGRWRNYVSELEPLLDELDRAGAVQDSVEDAQARAASLSDSHRPGAALGVLRRALVRTPYSPELLAATAMCQLRIGEHDAARALAEQVAAAAPNDWRAHVALCNVLAYSAGVSGGELSEAMRRYGALLPRSEPLPTFPSPGTKLRIGLLGSFHRSPISALTLRAFEAMDRETFEIVCFSVGGNNDAITARYRGLGAYFELGRLNDAQLVEQIRRERIDILIELTGHLRNGRLAVLARRPAPVQIKWVGAQYHTTGITEVDYLITDRHETPPELAPLYSEKLLVMPDSYVCWSPPDEAPEVAALPAERNGFITFGSFNSMMKITAATLAAWAAILERVPHSRLLLAAPALSESETVDRLRDVFRSRGISSDRIELRGWMPHRALLAAYNAVDVALSPFPYNAGVTLLEGLWMGVPAIALAGETFASRHGVSHLSAVGLADWSVTTVRAYIERAIAAADDRSALIALRSTLRERVRLSGVCDAERFVQWFGAGVKALV